MIYIDPATGAEQTINYKFDGTTAPGVNDDGATGHFAVGSEWFDISSTPKRRYSCVSNATGAAVWVDLTAIMPANEAGTAGQFLTAYNSTTGAWSKATPDHGGLGGLTDDDHTQYALLAGRGTGQTLIGGTGTTDDLILQATSGVGASGSDIIFKVGDNGGTEAARFLYNGKFGIGTNNPAYQLDNIGGDVAVIGRFASTPTTADSHTTTFTNNGTRLVIANLQDTTDNNATLRFQKGSSGTVRYGDLRLNVNGHFSLAMGTSTSTLDPNKFLFDSSGNLTCAGSVLISGVSAGASGNISYVYSSYGVTAGAVAAIKPITIGGINAVNSKWVSVYIDGTEYCYPLWLKSAL